MIIGKKNNLPKFKYKETNNLQKFRIFGKEFIKNNEKKCRIIIDNKEKKLIEIKEEAKQFIFVKLKLLDTSFFSSIFPPLI